MKEGNEVHSNQIFFFSQILRYIYRYCEYDIYLETNNNGYWIVGNMQYKLIFQLRIPITQFSILDF